jgi:hypothetical protein
VEYDLLKTAINDIDREGARTFEGEMFQAYNIGPGGVIEESGIEKQACGYDCRAPFEGLRSAPTVWAHSHNRYGDEGPSEFDRPIVRKQGNIGGLLLPDGTARLYWYDAVAERTRVWTMRGTPSREDVR